MVTSQGAWATTLAAMLPMRARLKTGFTGTAHNQPVKFIFGGPADDVIGRNHTRLQMVSTLMFLASNTALA